VLLLIKHSLKKSLKAICITSPSMNMKAKMKNTIVFSAKFVLKEKKIDVPCLRESNVTYVFRKFYQHTNNICFTDLRSCHFLPKKKVGKYMLFVC